MLWEAGRFQVGFRRRLPLGRPGPQRGFPMLVQFPNGVPDEATNPRRIGPYPTRSFQPPPLRPRPANSGRQYKLNAPADGVRSKAGSAGALSS